MLPEHNELADSKKLLKAFNCIYGRRQTVEALLRQATRIVVELLGVKCCMINWLIEGKGIMEVKAASYRSALDDGVEIIVTNDSRTAKIQEFWKSWQEGLSFPKGENAKKLLAPIRVNGEIVGNICIPDDETNNGNVHPINTALYSTICAHIGFALELQQMRQMLTSPDSPELAALDCHIFEITRKPEHVAKVIARSFYKHLRKGGFETKEILIVASEIIENLNRTLSRTKAKTLDFKAKVKTNIERS